MSDLEYHAEKCACGKNGRFRLYRGNGMKLCLDCMYIWLYSKLILKIKDEDKIFGLLFTGVARRRKQNR